MALQLGFIHPSIILAAKMVFGAVVLGSLAEGSHPIIIPWANSVEIISAEDYIVYRDGITGSHFSVGGMDQIIYSSPCLIAHYRGA